MTLKLRDETWDLHDRDENDFPATGRGYGDEQPDECRFCGRRDCTCEEEP